MATASHRLELAFWSAVPALITFALVLVYFMPKHMTGLASVMPPLHLISVFYWGMNNPRDMPYGFVFAVGLLMDVLSGLPLGVSAIIYVAFLMILRMQRRHIHKEGFLLRWLFFSVLLLVTSLMQWLLITSLGSLSHALLPLFIQWLIALCCFPLLARGLDMLHERMAYRRLQLTHSR